MIADLGIPVFQYPGYEADDIIATRATKAYTKPLVLTQIYSSDKDLKQLINDRTTQTDTMKHKTTTHDDFVTEYGFEPIYMSYYLALIGDTSDNIQ
jgi:DNA polymerase-1